MDNEPVHAQESAILLRDTADAKWRLLEVVLSFKNQLEQNAHSRAEIILLGRNFTPELQLAAQVLATVYGIDIHHAQPLGSQGQATESAQDVKPQKFRNDPSTADALVNPAPGRPYQITGETKLVQEFFSGTPSATRRTFDQHGKMRWSARARRDFTYVRQFGRLARDSAFWRERLSAADSVRPSKGEGRIQFRLHTRQDYLNFMAAITELRYMEWTGEAAYPSEDPET